MTMLSDQESRQAHLITRAGVRYLYFIQAEGGGPVKIGITSNPSRRLAQLRREHGEDLCIRRKVKVHESVALKMERNVHKHFGHLRLHGEWFAVDEELAKLGHCVL